MPSTEQAHPCERTLALDYFERAGHPKELVVLPGGHFEASVKPAFDVNAAAQLRWFRTHLT